MSGAAPANHHILSVLVENKAGVLARVASLFARRGYNIYSLAVAPTEDERFSRLTVVVDVDSAPLEQIVKQLFKLINVVKISELDPRLRPSSASYCSAPSGPRPRCGARSWSWCRSSRGRSSAVGADAVPPCRSTAIRTSSTTSRSCCAGYGIVELQRTGRVALPKLVRDARRAPSRERPAECPPPSTTKPTPTARSSSAARWP